MRDKETHNPCVSFLSSDVKPDLVGSIKLPLGGNANSCVMSDGKLDSEGVNTIAFMGNANSHVRIGLKFSQLLLKTAISFHLEHKSNDISGV